VDEKKSDYRYRQREEEELTRSVKLRPRREGVAGQWQGMEEGGVGKSREKGKRV